MRTLAKKSIAFLMGAIDQHRERVQSPVDQALHVLPGAPVGREFGKGRMSAPKRWPTREG